ncbi:unnamed protein product [Hymenolepis diminuta]|uniref:ubiquitinyl hydrolase 1 n=1 Tax=Hymenolepis diminuta TaxID=6216 RepID=A0A0R3SC57_HYMDI|nr:unnamed protein product [Hymenolepis diminuta]
MNKKLERRFWCLSTLTSPDEVTEFHVNEIYKLGKDACIVDGCRPIDPSNIAATLDLVPTVQQDAPEFHSLFLGLLGEYCPKIPDLFLGFDTYDTQCKNCNYLSRSYSKYIELEVMPSEKNLEDALKNMLREEVLEGANQYSCSNCCGKQDGSRRHRIIGTPKYINFHLMRFRMREDMSRDKVTDLFRFPDSLDMSPFVSDGITTNGKGGTNQSLKYVFTIPEESFNVSMFYTSITDLSSYTSRLQSSVSKTKAKEKDAGGRRSTHGKKSMEGDDGEGEYCGTTTPISDGYHSSTTAYLIIYRRKEEGEEKGDCGAALKTNKTAECEIQVPKDLQQEVEVIDYNKREGKTKEKEITLMRPIWRTRLFGLLRASNALSSSPKRPKLTFDDGFASLKDICIVPTKWLKKWFLSPDALPPQLIYSDEGKILPRAGDTTFQLKPFLCRHNRISPTNSLESIRAISLHQLELAFECTKFSDCPSIVSKGPSYLSPEALDILSPCIQCIRHRVTDNRFTEECEAIAKEMREWKKISGDGTYPLVKSVYDSVRGDDRSIPEDEHPLVYFIGTKSFATWRSLAQSHYSKALETAESISTEFNKDAVCPHGELMRESCRIVNPSIWRRLRLLFNPPFSAVATEISEYPSTSFKETVCLECCDTLSNIKIKAMSEIEKMRSILDASDYMPADRNLCELIQDVGENEDSGAIYLLPVEFIRQWRRFCKATKINNIIAFLPSGFECPNIRCEHNRLKMPWKELISENLAFPLSSREWNLMSHAYPPTEIYPPMRLISTDPQVQASETSELQFDPPNVFFQICESCYEELELDRLQFKNARLYIRLCDNPETAISLDAEEMGSKERASLIDRPRRSIKRRQDICVVVDGSMTLLKLRSMLIEHFSAYPMDQHLLVNGIELTDNQKSLYQLGVRPDMLIFAWLDASAPSIDLDYEFPDGDVPPGGSAAGKEVGFAGTRLTNL